MDLGHNKEIQNYISKVCTQVRFHDVHQDVKLELEAHIQEIIEEYSKQGFSEKQAVKQALVQMGDADIVGKQLDLVHKPKPDWTILVLSFLFVSMGLLAMYLIQKQSLLTYDIKLFEKSLLYSLMSLIAIIGLYYIDYRKLERFSKHIYLGTFIILIFTVFWGIQLNGSKSWLIIGPFSVNFVAVSPFLFIAALSGIFNKWDWRNHFKLLQGLALFAMPLILILIAPSISTGAIYVVAGIVLMIVSGAKLKQILLIPGSIMAMLILFIMTEPHRLNRLFTFLNPESDPSGSGWLNIQLSEIISHSGLLGQGLTFNPQIIPELHTDFVFAFITYTFGWIASILLITFVVIFLVRIGGIARQVKSNYGKLLISGFLPILVIQFLWNIFMNLGLAPLTTVGLPFISYGGSQLIINAALVGIISSIYRRKNISQNYSLS
ncbi:cell division protein [Desulfuribacillus stibiiarsenatis]|uniref:Cell division protein n=1 Tax=Desulfuribacillus stibiiarsenatis TaxID=1390249 RepID=A0A1E5L9L7_9FIRM|nr:FtsW/RodA/SpoVE family cell cycle protein [Desulfuribacillus stibiiarsenatis]OEH86840.1 cell division protein [Desulfuribacillus stibiiarsenatis]